MNSVRIDFREQRFKRDPIPALAALREEGPLVQGRLPIIGHVWLATSYEAVNHVLREHRTFVRDPRHAGIRRPVRSLPWMPRPIRVMARNMIAQDEPEHRRLRILVEQAFGRQSVSDMRPRIEILADRFLDDLERAASSSPEGADFVELFARPFPLAVICELLGLPEEDRPRFIRWARRFTELKSPLSLGAAIPGMWRIYNYLARQIAHLRTHPRPGLLSALIEAEHEGESLTEDELLAMAFLLLLAGQETTVHFLSGGVLALLDHPEQAATLMSDWSLLESAVDEILRYVSPVQLAKFRYAAHDMELYGQKVRRAEYVMPVLAAANFDPAEFAAPEQFLIERRPNRHVAFGAGIHVCLGLKLAKAEGAITFRRLLERFPTLELAVPRDAVPYAAGLGMRSVRQLRVRVRP